MIHYRCPSCSAKLETEDHAAGEKHPCPNCGQRLQVPGKVNQTVLGEVEPDTPEVPTEPTSYVRYSSVEVVYARDSWLPRWIWRPTRIQPPENTGETVIRFLGNMLRVGLALAVLKFILALAFLIVLAIVASCSGVVRTY